MLTVPKKRSSDWFLSIAQSDLPKGRNGKYKRIVLRLVSEIENLKHGRALKIPLDELPDTKANIRSALNRATRPGTSKLPSRARRVLLRFRPAAK
jgi:hypothetical protein